MTLLGLLTFSEKWPFASRPISQYEIWLNRVIQIVLAIGLLVPTFIFLERIHPKIRAVRVHLSTLLVISIAASVLLWANTSPHILHVTRNMGVSEPYDFVLGYGWPIMAYQRVHLYETSPFMDWFKNALTALIILSIVALSWEGIVLRERPKT